jgi:[protein-PII] uridylyltransferase
VAVGGFGRGELFPYSDVDVLLLLPDVHRRTSSRRGSRPSSAAAGTWAWRSAPACARWANAWTKRTSDVTVQTSLLESRLITGDKKLFTAFRKRFCTAIDPQAFFAAKTLEMRQRHHKFDDTPYALEPNCKESPGGLRDLQVVLWMTKAAGFGRRWDDLARTAWPRPSRCSRSSATRRC